MWNRFCTIHITNHTKKRWLDRQDIKRIEPLLTDVLINGKLV